MKTTLRKIEKFNPCWIRDFPSKWEDVVNKIGMDTEISPMQILEYAGIKDAMWCLRVFDYIDYCLFLADVAESVLSIFEAKHPANKAPRKAIKAVRDYKKGLINKPELNAAYAAAAAAAAYADVDAAYAAAYAAAAAAAYADVAADVDAAYAAAYAADVADVAKWQEIEALYIKHLKEKGNE